MHAIHPQAPLLVLSIARRVHCQLQVQGAARGLPQWVSGLQGDGQLQPPIGRRLLRKAVGAKAPRTPPERAKQRGGRGWFCWCRGVF